jgi:lipopolysaccharide export LptBFGC system permease protein LptF
MVISGFNFGFNETVVPLTTRQARYLYEVGLKNRKLRRVFDNQRTWVRIYGGFLTAELYDTAQRELQRVTIYQLEKDYTLRSIVHSKSALWQRLVDRQGSDHNYAETGNWKEHQLRRLEKSVTFGPATARSRAAANLAAISKAVT